MKNQSTNNIIEENEKKEIIKHKIHKNLKENNNEKYNKVDTSNDNEEQFLSEPNHKNNNNILSLKSSLDKPKFNSNKNKTKNNSIINQKENRKRKEKKEREEKKCEQRNKLLLHIINLRDINECLYKWIYIKESLIY